MKRVRWRIPGVIPILAAIGVAVIWYYFFRSKVTVAIATKPGFVFDSGEHPATDNEKVDLFHVECFGGPVDISWEERRATIECEGCSESASVERADLGKAMRAILLGKDDCRRIKSSTGVRISIVSEEKAGEFR